MAKDADSARAPSEPERRLRYPDGDYLIDEADEPDAFIVCYDGRLVRTSPYDRSG